MTLARGARSVAGATAVAGAVAMLAGCAGGARTACVGGATAADGSGGCAPGAVEAGAARSGGAEAVGRSGELRVTLAVTPTVARAGAAVRVTVVATDPHTQGALGYVVRYGDGATVDSSPVPQFCLAGAGRPAHQTWALTHHYRVHGRYAISATAHVNCTDESATALTRVVVR